MNEKLQPVIDFAKKMCNKAKSLVKKADKKLSETYAEYDIDVKGKVCLSPCADSESESKDNTVNSSYNGKIKFSAKDVICFLAIFAVFFSLIKSIVKTALK